DVFAERMVLAMINEAARCLEEKVVTDAGMLDVAMIFGAGFPPFRGGLLRHADTLGLSKVEARLLALQAEKGEPFQPAGLLARPGMAPRAPPSQRATPPPPHPRMPMQRALKLLWRPEPISTRIRSLTIGPLWPRW